MRVQDNFDFITVFKEYSTRIKPSNHIYIFSITHSEMSYLTIAGRIYYKIEKEKTQSRLKMFL